MPLAPPQSVTHIPMQSLGLKHLERRPIRMPAGPAYTYAVVDIDRKPVPKSDAPRHIHEWLSLQEAVQIMCQVRLQ